MTEFIRRHKLALRSAALAGMMITPVLLYWAARADAAGWTGALLGLMAVIMLLTIRIG